MRLTKPNRIASRAPTRTRYWCRCDQSRVGQSGKCRICGHSAKGAKDKKPGPLPERQES